MRFFANLSGTPSEMTNQVLNSSWCDKSKSNCLDAITQYAEFKQVPYTRPHFRAYDNDEMFVPNRDMVKRFVYRIRSIPNKAMILLSVETGCSSGEAWSLEWKDLKRHTAYFIDLSKKIVVFYDLPNYELLKNLRSLLSHDNAGNRISTYLVTDKAGNGSHRTKKVLIKGYFTALFASAFGEMDEQEISRNYLLSPSDNPDKIKKGIELQARKMTDPQFNEWYETEPSRVGLKQRVQRIKEANIKKVLFKAEDMENLKDWFFKNIDNLAPKSQRDFPRLYALAEAWALLNFQHRERTPDNSCIYANSTDIENAKKVYEPILKCNGLGLTPEEYAVWKIIEKTFDESQTYTATGLRIQEIHNIYSYEKQRRCSDKRLRGMLKNFCSAGLLKEEKEGVIIKYYPITHRETKQSGLTLSTLPLEKVESNPLFQRQ